MKLYVKHDRDAQDVIWVGLPDTPPHRPVADTYGMAQIDRLAETRLKEILDEAENKRWGAYGATAVTFAEVITLCLKRIVATTPPAFTEEGVIVCPEPLAEALSIPDGEISFSEWISRFPKDETPEPSAPEEVTDKYA